MLRQWDGWLDGRESEVVRDAGRGNQARLGVTLVKSAALTRHRVRIPSPAPLFTHLELELGHFEDTKHIL